MPNFNASISRYSQNSWFVRAITLTNAQVAAISAANFPASHHCLSDLAIAEDDDLHHATHQMQIPVTQTLTVHCLAFFTVVIAQNRPATFPTLYLLQSNYHLGYPTSRPANPIATPTVLPSAPSPPAPPPPVACNDPTHAPPFCSDPTHVNFQPCMLQHVQPGPTPAIACNLTHTTPADYQILHDHAAGTLCSIAAHAAAQPAAPACQLAHATPEHDTAIADATRVAARETIRTRLLTTRDQNLVIPYLRFLHIMNNHSWNQHTDDLPRLFSLIDEFIASARQATAATPAPQLVNDDTVAAALAPLAAVTNASRQHIGRFLLRTHTHDEITTFNNRLEHTCHMHDLCPLRVLLLYYASLTPQVRRTTNLRTAMIEMPMRATRTLAPLSPFLLPLVTAVTPANQQARLSAIPSLTIDELLNLL